MTTDLETGVGVQALLMSTVTVYVPGVGKEVYRLSVLEPAAWPLMVQLCVKGLVPWAEALKSRQFPG